MFSRREFLKLAAGAIAGLFAGKVVLVTEPPVTTKAAAEPVEGFTGEIESVHIFDRALTPAEVAQYYARDRPNSANPLNEGLVAFWPASQSDARCVMLFPLGEHRRADREWCQTVCTRDCDCESGALAYFTEEQNAAFPTWGA